MSYQDDVAAIVNQQPQPGGYGFPTATESSAPAASVQGTMPANPINAIPGAGAFTGGPQASNPNVSPVSMDSTAGNALRAAAPFVPGLAGALPAKADAGGPDFLHRAEDKRIDEQVDHERERLKREGKLGDTKAGAPNPYATPAAGGGGPSAPAFDPTAAGYAAMGVNAKDPRQVAAAQAAAEQGKATQDLAVKQANEAYQQGRAQQAASFGQADQMREDAALEAKHRAEDAAAAKPHLDRYMKLQQDLASEKIDPDLIYRGTAGGVRRVTSAIGVALGAVGAVYGHTENFAQKIVEQQVNNSIDAQKANLANKRQVAENEKGVYTMFREQGADDATARSATRALAYSAAAKDAEGIASGLKNEDQRRAADMQVQQLRSANASAYQDFTMKANANGYAQAEARRKEAAAAANEASKGGEDVKDVSVDLAAEWLRNHPEEVASAYSKGGRILNYISEKTGLDFDAPENKEARRRVEKVLGGEMIGRVNDDRLATAKKPIKNAQDVGNVVDERYQEMVRKEDLKRRGVKVLPSQGGGPAEP